MKPNGSLEKYYLSEYERLRNLLTEIYTPLQVRNWLLTQNAQLDGHSPAELILQGNTEVVEQLIAQIIEE
jgi:hypothetical protein